MGSVENLTLFIYAFNFFHGYHIAGDATAAGAEAYAEAPKSVMKDFF